MSNKLYLGSDEYKLSSRKYQAYLTCLHNNKIIYGYVIITNRRIFFFKRHFLRKHELSYIFSLHQIVNMRVKGRFMKSLEIQIYYQGRNISLVVEEGDKIYKVLEAAIQTARETPFM